jgi:hypothetical protein
MKPDENERKKPRQQKLRGNINFQLLSVQHVTKGGSEKRSG